MNGYGGSGAMTMELETTTKVARAASRGGGRAVGERWRYDRGVRPAGGGRALGRGLPQPGGSGGMRHRFHSDLSVLRDVPRDVRREASRGESARRDRLRPILRARNDRVPGTVAGTRGGRLRPESGGGLHLRREGRSAVAFRRSGAPRGVAARVPRAERRRVAGRSRSVLHTLLSAGHAAAGALSARRWLAGSPT